jgi:uncharacterized membrane protein HdeD (DUF308 family)
MPQITGLVAGIIAVVFGIIVLIVPRILNYLVAAFLIIAGGIAIYQALV